MIWHISIYTYACNRPLDDVLFSKDQKCLIGDLNKDTFQTPSPIHGKLVFYFKFPLEYFGMLENHYIVEARQ